MKLDSRADNDNAVPSMDALVGAFVELRIQSVVAPLQAELAELRAALMGQDQEYVSIKEACRRLDRSPGTVRRWVREGLLRATKPDGRIDGMGSGSLLIEVASINEMLTRGRVAAGF